MGSPLSPPLLEFDDVRRVYGSGDAEVKALAGVSLTVAAGEFVAVTGPSGSGKSTTMNIIGCLDVATSGTFRFQGVPVETLSRDERALLRRHYIGFVFQGLNLLKRTTALENVEMALVYRGVPRQQRRERAREALRLVGLADREDHTSAQLSGGQQQRVAIARAMVTQPLLLLADEPTGNLDTPRAHEILELITRLNREQGLTVVLVTHEADIAAYADRNLRFRDGLLAEDVRRDADVRRSADVHRGAA